MCLAVTDKRRTHVVAQFREELDKQLELPGGVRIVAAFNKSFNGLSRKGLLPSQTLTLGARHY
jgi:hypothetical protein